MSASTNEASTRNTMTAPAQDRPEAEGPQQPAKAPGFPQIRLVPANGSDQPVLANYATVEVAPSMVYLDFGFIEPGLIMALQSAVQSKSALPERIGGRLATRVAVGIDVLQVLHRQLGVVIEGVTSAAHQQLAAYNDSQNKQAQQNKH